ncbi:MAG: universal stress protein [Parvularculaceae bacterium]|nr:universal stress protein [Parvularculaceae bacterium]
MGEPGEKRFSILLCIDGSEESFRGLHYAVRIGKGNDADITLLFIRPVDRDRESGGLEMNLMRQNMLEWGLQLPGMKHLERARETLIELGYMNETWKSETVHREVYGDPVGDNMVIYTSDTGARIVLKLMVSPSVARGVLDECELNPYDLTIIAMQDNAETSANGQINWNVARTVVTEHHGVVLLAREIEENHGHLICVTADERSIAAAQKDAIIASRCNCPVYILSVAENDAEQPMAETAIALARNSIENAGVKVEEAVAVVGDPITKIIEHGKPYSVIVMADSEVKGFRRFFHTSVAYEVLRCAYNSVMIMR